MGTRKISYSLNTNGCWICTSHAMNSAGYPLIQANNKRCTVARYLYETEAGNIPTGLLLRHTCDNTLCINPSHMIIGTHSDNVMDRVTRKRSATGERNGRAKLKAIEVILIFLSSEPQIELARRYGVDPGAIRAIKNRVTWKTVTAEL